MDTETNNNLKTQEKICCQTFLHVNEFTYLMNVFTQKLYIVILVKVWPVDLCQSELKRFSFSPLFLLYSHTATNSQHT